MYISFTDIWNMLSIHWRKIICGLGLICICLSANAQLHKIGANFQNFSTKPYYFGLGFAYSNSNFKIKHSSEFIRNDTFLVAEGINSPGFSVNLIGNLKFGQDFDFRVLPGFSFTDRTIIYRTKAGNRPLIDERIESVFVNIPFQFRYKSQPYKNKRLFVSGGLKYSFDVSNNSRTRQAKSLIKITPHDFAAEVGAGIQIFFEYFIFSPEIRFSHGISSSYIQNRELERANVLDKLISRSISITLNFEG